MNERLILKGRLVDINKRLKEIELKADAYISVIREIIDPYGGDFTDFDMEKFMVLAKEFYELYKEAKALKEQKAKLEEALYG